MKNVSNQDLLHALNQRARLFAKSINTSLKDHGLYASQWSILFCLHQYGAMTQTEIWKYLNVEAPTVTRTLAKMEKSGWVIRKQGVDKRERIIELTGLAVDEFPTISEKVSELENDLLSEFTPDEKDQFYHLLNKLK